MSPSRTTPGTLHKVSTHLKAGNSQTYLSGGAPIIMFQTELRIAIPATTGSDVHELARLASPPALQTVSVHSDLSHPSACAFASWYISKHEKRKPMRHRAYSLKDSAFQPHMPLLPAPLIISLTRQFSTQSLEYTFIACPLTPFSRASCHNSALNSTCCISVRRCTLDTGSW